MSASSVKWVKIGSYIEQYFVRNSDGLYGESDAIGVNIEKEILPMRGNISEKDFTNFYLVPPGCFAYNPRGSRKLGLGYNATPNTYIITFNDVVFRIKPSAISSIIPEYLFLYLCRKEWDRKAEYLSWGSSTEVFSWETLCDVEIPLPSIEVQQELVDTYNGLKALAEQNEALIEPLSKACEAFIVDCKTKYPEVELGKYIEEFDKRNNAGCEYPFYGINKDKTFMPTVADTNNLDNTKYKVVSSGDFVFSGMQTGRDVCIRIALYDGVNSIIISPAYTTFKVKGDVKILPQYLFLQFKRFEMDRYGWFLSDGSIRSNLEWERFCEIKLPLPPMETQRSIVNLYNCLEEAKKIASEAREKLKTLCSALVQRAANS